MEGMRRDRLSTPPPRSPRQNPTPQTPEPRARRADTTTDRSLAAVDWLSFGEERIAGLTLEEAKHHLGDAVKSIAVLQRDKNMLAAQRSHYKFNLDMLMAEREESALRVEVESTLSATNQRILSSRLERSIAEEELLRQRHLRAKKKVAELKADSKRQQLCLEHLRRQTGDRQEFGPALSRPGSGPQIEGGLEVLSDAAGLAQLRDRDREDSFELEDTGSLLPPLIFPSSDGRASPDRLQQRKRHHSEDTVVDGVPQDDVLLSKAQSVGRRLTFNSGGPGKDFTRVAPMTPRSPRRERLGVSALS